MVVCSFENFRIRSGKWRSNYANPRPPSKAKPVNSNEHAESLPSTINGLLFPLFLELANKPSPGMA
ncbi:MAG: hypothetical protein CMO55_20885 [Verrucomicrobiales bacterium]|nr:hypothetical protein [Verrucomicrobiales bacterium]